MLKSVNLLMLDNIVGNPQSKLTKDKELYQLQNVDYNKYILTPFRTLVFKGYFKQYLLENNIRLCFKVEDSDLFIQEAFENQIENYFTNDTNEYLIKNDKSLIKSYRRRDFDK
ncbi:MAG: hypothetical protein PHT75_04030 [Bacilli bacterium]|nr:hypothetical protein [Bacilli bacterium]